VYIFIIPVLYRLCRLGSPGEDVLPFITLQPAVVAAFCEMPDLCTTFGSAFFLVLVPAGFLVAFLLDPTSDIWASNMALFMGIWLLYNFFGTDLVERLLSRKSVLFNGMESSIKRQDAFFVVFVVGSLFLWAPAGAILTIRVLRVGPVEYISLYGGATRCFYLMGIMGEIVDLFSRHRLSKEVILHHTIEFISGGIMVDSSIRKLEPGFLFVAMMPVLGKSLFVSLMFDHVSREGASDAVFPAWCLSQKGRRRIFSVAAVWSFGKLVLLWVCICSYLALYHEDVSVIDTVWLPCLAALLSVVFHVPLVRFFHDKTHAHP